MVIFDYFPSFSLHFGYIGNIGSQEVVPYRILKGEALGAARVSSGESKEGPNTRVMSPKHPLKGHFRGST